MSGLIEKGILRHEGKICNFKNAKAIISYNSYDGRSEPYKIKIQFDGGDIVFSFGHNGERERDGVFNQIEDVG